MKTNVPTTSMQLHMIYGLLKPSIRSTINRTDIEDFEELVSKVREVEAISEETTTQTQVAPKKVCSFCNFRGHIADEVMSVEKRKT